MRKMSLSLVAIVALVVFSVAAAGLLPATVHAASGIDMGKCASEKAKCNKNGGGQNGQGGGQPVQTTTPAQGAACAGFNQIGSGVSCDEGDGGSTGQSAIGGAVNTVVNILSYVAGILGIIFIIVSGFRYITSNGDQNRVASAKTTLVYALIGITVAALAQIIVHFVLNLVNG